MFQLVRPVFMICKVAKELRENVCNETGLTCSAGVAPNRLLAKVLCPYIGEMIYFSSHLQYISSEMQ